MNPFAASKAARISGEGAAADMGFLSVLLGRRYWVVLGGAGDHAAAPPAAAGGRGCGERGS
ncbi:hypothetical protein GCM10023220_11570 [Streptomyces ziwulingensis]|uniref:Uncharacterized protein n=1 Tax=Streptomyces ziwulingensis TaxID=1045501 RepID=A0ABP9B2A1_9ACTN